MHSLLVDYEVIHRLVGAGVVFNNISGASSTFLLLEYSTEAISMLPTLFVTKVPLEGNSLFNEKEVSTRSRVK